MPCSTVPPVNMHKQNIDLQRNSTLIEIIQITMQPWSIRCIMWAIWECTWQEPHPRQVNQTYGNLKNGMGRKSSSEVSSFLRENYWVRACWAKFLFCMSNLKAIAADWRLVKLCTRKNQPTNHHYIYQHDCSSSLARGGKNLNLRIDNLQTTSHYQGYTLFSIDS